MASNWERTDDYCDELLVAIYLGDLALAERILAQMLAIGLWTGSILSARRKVKLVSSAEIVRTTTREAA